MTLRAAVAGLVATIAVVGCDSQRPTFRDIYEHHLDLYEAQVKELLDACPYDAPLQDGESPPPLQVRSISAPQPSGVYLAVEFSQFTTHSRAKCVDDFLEAHGAKEFETDTHHWPSEETFFASSTSTSGET